MCGCVISDASAVGLELLPPKAYIHLQTPDSVSKLQRRAARFLNDCKLPRKH